MNIFISCERLTPGGAETRIFTFVNEFVKMDHNVFIASARGELVEGIKQIGCHYIKIDFDNVFDFKEQVEYLENVFLKEKIDIIHIHPYYPLLPCVIAARKCKISYIVTVHNSFNPLKQWGVERGINIYEQFFISYALPNATHVIAVSPEVSEWLIKTIKIDKKKVTIVPNAVDPINFCYKGFSEDKKEFLLISRLDNDKLNSIKHGIELFKQYKERSRKKCELTVVGGGSIENEIIQSLQKLNDYFGENVARKIERQSKIWELMEKSDVVIGMGRVVIEAGMMGKITVLVGDKGIHGIIKARDIQMVSKTNFSGRGIPIIPIQICINDIEKHNQKKAKEISNILTKNYSSSQWAKKKLKIYNKSLFSDAQIIEPVEFTKELINETVKGKYVELQRNYTELQKQYDQLSIRHDEIYRWLNTIINSTSWKILERYRKWRKIIFSEGSRLERFYFLILKGIKVLLDEGVKSFVLRFGRRIWRKISMLGPVAAAYRTIAKLKAVQRKSISAYYGIGEKGLVSVILPVYNQAYLVGEAIQGVLDQTYKNFELIIVDDGSNDNINEVLNKFKNNRSIKVFRQVHQNLPKSLNNGFKWARGEFYTWTSADNIMHPHQLERQVKFLVEHPYIAMVYCDYEIIDDDGKPLLNSDFRIHNQDPQASNIIRLPRTTEKLALVNDNFIGPCFLYRASIGKTIGDYDPTMGIEDYDYWMRVNHFFKISHLGTDDILYQYRVHKDTLSARADDLGIYKKANVLMVYEKERQSFYNKPFDLYVDRDIKNLLSNDIQKYLQKKHRLYLLNEFVKNKQSDEKRIIYMNIRDMSLLDNINVSDSTVICIVSLEEDDAVYDILPGQWNKVNCCFVLNEAEFRRISIFKNDSFFVKKIDECIKIGMIYADTHIYQRITRPSEQREIHPAKSIVLENIKIPILFQVDQFDKGGLERVVFDLASTIDSNKYIPVILAVSKGGVFEEISRKKGIEVFVLSGENRKKFHDFLKFKNIGIVNAHHSYFGLDIAFKLGIPVFQTIHSCYVWNSDPEGIIMLKKADSFTQRYIAVSNDAIKYTEKKFNLDPAKISKVHNGINARFIEDGIKMQDSETLRRHLGFSKDEFIFLNVASIYPPKFQMPLIDAIAILREKYPHTKLLFVGEILDHKYYRDLIGRARSLGISDCVTFAGYKTNVFDYYRVANAYVLPSLVEGWSITLLEAIYFALPVIATAIGGARELIPATGSGILIPNVYKDIMDLNRDDLSNINKFQDNKIFLDNLTHAMESIITGWNMWKERMQNTRGKLIELYDIEDVSREYDRIFTYYS